MPVTGTGMIADYVRLDAQYAGVVDEVMADPTTDETNVIERTAQALRDAAAERLLGGLLLARPDFALIEAERGIDYSAAAGCVRLMVQDALEATDWIDTAEELIEGAYSR